MVKDEPRRRHPYSSPHPRRGQRHPSPGGKTSRDSTSKRPVRHDLAALTLQDRLLCHRVDGRQPRLLRVAQNHRPQGSGDIPQAIRGAEAHAGGARVSRTPSCHGLYSCSRGSSITSCKHVALSLCHPVIWSSPLAKSAHIAPGGLELLLAQHFPGADAGQDQATLHGGPKHMLRLLGEVLVDVLPARDCRDRGRGDGRVSPGALV